MSAAPSSDCPCGSGRDYVCCCGTFHAGAAAPTAEALMRSRYAAYVLELEPYLLATWHPSTRPEEVAFERGTKWLGLKVIEAKTTGDDAEEVEFVARYKLGGGSAVRLHERSRFVRKDGRWLYVDGDVKKK